MKRKLILHIGTEKTGTTTIQDFLYINRDILLRKGVYIPNTLGHKNHRKLATVCMQQGHTDDHHKALNLDNEDKIEKWKQKQISTMTSELNSINSPITIISSEHFSSRLTSKKEVIELFKILNSIFDDIEVVLYLRRQDKYAVSLYSTALKEGLTNRVILPEHILKERYDYNYICNLWSSVFQKLNVRIFEREELVGNDLITDFLCFLNINDNIDFIKTNDANPSISHIAQEFLLAWNKLHPKYTCDGIDINHHKIVSFLEKEYNGKPRLPIKSHVISWMTQYDKSNTEVLRKYFPKKDSLFSKNYETYPESHASVDIALEIIKIYQHISIDVKL